MTTIYAIHAPQPERLVEVEADMRRLGQPTIQVVDRGDYYMALEGSHRLAAAHSLGIEPMLEVFEGDDWLDIEGFDWFEEGFWARTRYQARDVAEELYSAWQAVPYAFESVQTQSPKT